MAVNEAPGGARSALKSVSRVFLSLPILTLATLLISLIIGVPIGTQLRQEAVTVSAVTWSTCDHTRGGVFQPRSGQADSAGGAGASPPHRAGRAPQLISSVLPPVWAAIAPRPGT